MAKITTIAELAEIKKNTLAKISQSDEIKIVVGMGTCGISAGADETMQSIKEEVEEQGLKNIEISLTGCIGLCVQEPLVEIKKPGQENIIFKLVDRARAKEIINQYVINDFVNKDWIVN